jgi:hypothetical protein
MIDTSVTHPYVKMQLSDIWKHDTDIQDKINHGCAVFDNLDLEINVTDAVLRDKQIQLEVYNKNVLGGLVGDTLIGRASTSLRQLGAVLDKEHDLPMTLLNADGKSAGRIVLFASVHDGVSIEDDKGPVLKDFCMHINSINAHDLKNVEIMGKQVCMYVCYM